MLRHERWEEPANAVEAAIGGKQAEMWTAIPGIVQKFNAQNNTVEVQPAVQRRRLLPTGKWINETLSPCVDVPVHFPAGGGFTLTVPVKAGDEVLLVFSSRCIDGWWDKGGVQPQTVPRMHDPSDGFAILGTRSKKRALANVSTTNVQLRADDGKTFLEIDANQTVRIVAPTKVRLETPLLEVTGDIKAGGDVMAHAGVAGVSLRVSTGSTSTSSTPTTTDVPTTTTISGILHIASQVDQVLQTGDFIQIAGALAIGSIPGGSEILNAVHTVASVIDSRNFTALLSGLLPGQIQAIAGNPIMQAIVHLVSHDHHGVRAGSEISQKPVTGT
jgi:hypothetical protein